MIAERTLTLARRVNWWLPGVGLIIAHRMWLGLAIAVLFTLLANFMIWGALVVPESMPRTLLAVAGALLIAIYGGAQFLLARDLHLRQAAAARIERARALRELQQHVASGEIEQALACVDQLHSHAEGDLLVAFHIAQTLTAAEDAPRGIEAWLRVRRLDAQAIYRREADAAEAQLRRALSRDPEKRNPHEPP
ncbi:MAG: hypothetical protein JNG88_17790 [Phycisphaerales bacterium]|nr:hypothetical protein [Phycisphaerales bacterium]